MMATASSSCTLSAKDIKYDVTLPGGKETKEIVRGVSCTVKSGQMLCIMGPSGSGKTSFINILAKKLTPSPKRNITGEVLLNGESLTATQFRHLAGMVTQEDVFEPVLTVGETLSFASRLRIRDSRLRAKRVDEVIALLQLQSCRKTQVGDDSRPELKGISGGEKRRLAIASELLDPDMKVLILDEPTSGLDAASALMVANLLHELAQTGTAIISTLHQPRAQITRQFNDLMVLADGRCMFYGGVSDFSPYITDVLRADLPSVSGHEDVALGMLSDFMLDVLNPTITPEASKAVRAMSPDMDSDRMDALAKLYGESPLAEKMSQGAAQSMTGFAGGTSLAKAVSSSHTRVGWFVQFFTLLARTGLVKIRDPVVATSQMAMALGLGVIFGAIYWQVYDRSDEFVILDVQMAVGMAYVMCTFIAQETVAVFPLERRIFMRERKAGLYCTSAQYMSRIMADVPSQMLAGTVLTAIVYPMSGLEMGYGYCWFLGNLSVLIGAAVIQVCSAFGQAFEDANALMVVMLLLFLTLSPGFVREVPSWLEWLRNISFTGLLIDIAVYLELRDIEERHGTRYGTLDEILNTETTLTVKTDEDMQSAFAVLAAIYVISRFLAYLGVKFMYTGQSFKESLWQ